jgi:hypothetical protein
MTFSPVDCGNPQSIKKFINLPPAIHSSSVLYGQRRQQPVFFMPVTDDSGRASAPMFQQQSKDDNDEGLFEFNRQPSMLEMLMAGAYDGGNNYK